MDGLQRTTDSRELIEHALLRACRSFLVPIVRFLMRHGLTYSVFSEQAKWAFIHVATREYGVRGREATISNIARVTDLSRQEIKRLKALSHNDDDVLATWWRNLGDILQRWHTDAEFLDAHGNPLDLSIAPDEGFSVLVKRYGGQMPPATALRDLKRIGCIRELADGRIRVSARSVVTPGGDAESVHHFGETLANVAATMSHNFAPDRADPPFLEKFVWADGLSKPVQTRFRRICADQGYRFLEAMDDWLSSNSDPSQATETDCLSIGVGIYYFEKAERDATPFD